MLKKKMTIVTSRNLSMDKTKAIPWPFKKSSSRYLKSNCRRFPALDPLKSGYTRIGNPLAGG